MIFSNLIYLIRIIRNCIDCHARESIFATINKTAGGWEAVQLCASLHVCVLICVLRPTTWPHPLFPPIPTWTYANTPIYKN